MINIILIAIIALAASHEITVQNGCSETLWIGVLNNANQPLPEGGGFVLEAGASHSLNVDHGWGGRFFGRTKCNADGTGCETANCGHGTKCGGTGGQNPATLVEILFDGAGGKDFYDISLVNGFNLPVSLTPIGGSGPTGKYSCTAAACAADVIAVCPPELQFKSPKKDRVVGCYAACDVLITDPVLRNAYCCSGPNSVPATCPPTDYSRIFKSACPDAYSYAYDDQTSTFTCSGTTGYEIKFCPSGATTPAAPAALPSSAPALVPAAPSSAAPSSAAPSPAGASPAGTSLAVSSPAAPTSTGPSPAVPSPAAPSPAAPSPAAPSPATLSPAAPAPADSVAAPILGDQALPGAEEVAPSAPADTTPASSPAGLPVVVMATPAPEHEPFAPFPSAFVPMPVDFTPFPAAFEPTPVADNDAQNFEATSGEGDLPSWSDSEWTMDSSWGSGPQWHF